MIILLLLSALATLYCAVNEKPGTDQKRPGFNFFLKLTVALAIAYLFIG